MLARRLIGKGNTVHSLERRPLMFVQSARIKQPLPGRVLPLVLPAESNRNGPAFRYVLLRILQFLDASLRPSNSQILCWAAHQIFPSTVSAKLCTASGVVLSVETNVLHFFS